jgi:hypothetical protein
VKLRKKKRSRQVEVSQKVHLLHIVWGSIIATFLATLLDAELDLEPRKTNVVVLSFFELGIQFCWRQSAMGRIPNLLGI